MDTCLPFGLCFAPFLFNQLSTAIHWILQHKYHVCYLLHYLDDFFTAGSPDSSECSNNLTTMLSLCEHINAPVKPSKIEGLQLASHSWELSSILKICKQAYLRNANKICFPYCCLSNPATSVRNSNFFLS